MKTYEEMTRSVMDKVRSRRAARKRRNTRLALSAASLCLVMVSAVLIGSLTGENAPSVTLENPTTVTSNGPSQDVTVSQVVKPRFTLLCASTDGEPPKVMAEKVKVPYKAELRVRDVAGLSAQERQNILEEENAYVHAFLGEDPDESGYGRYARDNVIITLIQEGTLSIAFDDIESVARVQVSATENGYIFYPRIAGIKYTDWNENGLTVAVDGDSLRKGLEKLDTDNFVMIWQFANSVADRINADPNMDLSQLSDQITIRIDYTDGREEVSVVRMQVDSDGKVYAVLEETLISA